jgi:hypothetical protein
MVGSLNWIEESDNLITGNICKTIHVLSESLVLQL